MYIYIFSLPGLIPNCVSLINFSIICEYLNINILQNTGTHIVNNSIAL